MIQLGDVAKDRVTGFEGVVVSRTEYLFGCRRIVLQPQKLKDGKPLESQVFDEPQCTLVRGIARTTLEAIKATARTGGPRPVPAARREPPRR